ncbi:MAG: gliding motility-associated C-terminal domain-containing protein [Bacteroidetes bacterium]|nr:gliding motility-associated C-terminal domain-containing protein [Bacteroidota bacterium]
MFIKFQLIKIFFGAFLCLAPSIFCQNTYTFNPGQKNEDCTKGSAAVEILSPQAGDTITITWSNGQTGVLSISNLSAGNYNVHVVIKNKLDTTLNYKIEKEKCRVGLSNHFTPNGDEYNDLWQLSNVHEYPKFELYVFNKWGQQVHSQKGSYTPWDGKWNGINALDGTYYYVFYYDGGNKHDFEKGDVTILR